MMTTAAASGHGHKKAFSSRKRREGPWYHSFSPDTKPGEDWRSTFQDKPLEKNADPYLDNGRNRAGLLLVQPASSRGNFETFFAAGFHPAALLRRLPASLLTKVRFLLYPIIAVSDSEWSYHILREEGLSIWNLLFHFSRMDMGYGILENGWIWGFIDTRVAFHLLPIRLMENNDLYIV